MLDLQNEIPNSVEVFELSCELFDISDQLVTAKDELERLGIVPGEVNVKKSRNPRWRKKVLAHLRQVESLTKRGVELRDRLAELGVPIEQH